MTEWQGLTPPYSTIVADPPWPYAVGAAMRQRESGRSRFLPYSTMSLTDLSALDVSSLGCVDAHLFLWTTHGFLWDAPAVAQSWGFRVRQVLVWCKAPTGESLGGAFTPQTEFVLVCRGLFGRAIRRAREDAGLSLKDVHAAIRGGSPTGLVGMWEQSIRYPNPENWEALRTLLGCEFPTAGNLSSVDRNWWTWRRGQHSEKPAAFLDLVEQVAPEPYVELFARRQRLGWDSWGLGYEVAS